jgi:hypothetical protein
MGGWSERENIVELTAEEHYVAHQLLVKMYPGVTGLAFAAVRMARQCSGNKTYGWLRRRVAAAKRGTKHSMKTREKMAKSSRHNKPSKEAIAKTVALWLGRKHTLESRLKMSAAKKGKATRPRTDEEKAKIRSGNVLTKSCLDRYNSAYLFDPEYKKKQSGNMVRVWALRKGVAEA